MSQLRFTKAVEEMGFQKCVQLLTQKKYFMYSIISVLILLKSFLNKF